MLLAAEPSILSKGILSTMRSTKIRVFGDQIPWLAGPNSLTYFSPSNALPWTFASIPRNPYFCRVFFKFGVLHEDSPKMARNACQKECYYLVSEPGGGFLCWDQIPSCAKFAVLPVGMLKPVFSPETSIFIAFSISFPKLDISDVRGPPPTIFYLILRSPPLRTQKVPKK